MLLSFNSILRIAVWLIFLIGGATISFFLDAIFFPEIHNSALFHVFSFLLGLPLLLAVVKISKNTGRTLAKYGRIGKLKMMETNKLVTEGSYKYMRHPMNLGLTFFPISVALLIGSASFILIVAPLEMIIILIMIKFIEEPEAIRNFGKKYIEYKKNVPWFCFRKECLKILFKNCQEER